MPQCLWGWGYLSFLPAIASPKATQRESMCRCAYSYAYMHKGVRLYVDEWVGMVLVAVGVVRVGMG